MKSNPAATQRAATSNFFVVHQQQGRQIWVSQPEHCINTTVNIEKIVEEKMKTIDHNNFII